MDTASISFYQERLNLVDATYELIAHDDTMIATVYRITQPDGSQSILKICPKADHYRHELFFLTYFADTLPVPRIIQVVEPTIEHQGALLIECLPGAPTTIADVTETISYQMGKLLGFIHSHTTFGYGDLLYPKTLRCDPRATFALKFEESFAECQGYLPQELLDRHWSYYQEHLELFAAVDGPCITHRDFRPGNIMVYNGHVQGIIDWSSSRASFAQEDFSSMEHGEWSKDDTTKESFLLGYATVRPVPDYQEIMPLLRIMRAFAVVGYFVKHRQESDRTNHWYRFNRHFLETFDLFRY